MPGPLDGRLWGETMAGFNVPQQYQVIDIADQGSGSLRGFGGSVLRVFHTEELFHVAEADLQWPAQSKGFEYLWRFQGPVGREEAIVAAAATHDHGPQRYAAALTRRCNKPARPVRF